jgi:hypothetical protein
MAHNEPGKEPPVKIEESPVRDLRNRLSAPPCSVTLYSLETLGDGQAPATAGQ